MTSYSVVDITNFRRSILSPSTMWNWGSKFMASHTRRRYFSVCIGSTSNLTFVFVNNCEPSTDGTRGRHGWSLQAAIELHSFAPLWLPQWWTFILHSGLWPKSLHGITNQNTVLFLKHVLSPRKHISHFEIPCKSAPRGIRFDYRPTVRLLWWFPSFPSFARCIPGWRLKLGHSRFLQYPPLDAIRIAWATNGFVKMYTTYRGLGK